MTEEEAHERIRQAYLAALDAAKKHPNIKEAYINYMEAAAAHISVLQNPDATEEQKNAAFIEWQNKIEKFNDNNKNPTS